MAFSRRRHLASAAGTWRARWALAALTLAGLGTGCAGGGNAGGGSVSSGIVYSGPATWSILGREGGPFSNTSMTVFLDNPGNQSIAWSATSVPSFVHLDQLAGEIQPQSRIGIDATLSSAVAEALVPGTYTEALAFHNDSSPQADIDIGCTLEVQMHGTTSQLAPEVDFSAQGGASGPFAPDNTVYSLTNTGSIALSWQAHASEGWVAVLPPSGELASGATVDVTVAIRDTATISLAIGKHASVVEFQDASNSAVLHTRSVDLDILADSSSGGWTVFPTSVDTRIVYVSSSVGNDFFNGLAIETPKRSIAAGKALLRNGYPDRLLLKKGDVWDEPLGHWELSGRSLSERMLISSYGAGVNRPLLRTGVINGFDADHGTEINHLAIVGLRFWAHGFTGSQGAPRGLQLLGAMDNFLLEDCYIQAYDSNLVVQGTPEGVGRHTNIAIRRNIIVDAFTTGTSNTAGIYVSGTDGLLIEENVIDHNGWREDIPGSDPNWFRHNIYLQNGCTDVVVRGNIVAGTDGLQQRPGGLCEGNLFLRNALALQFGSGTTPEPEGVSGVVRRNVILDGRDLDAPNARGWGLIIGNVVDSTFEYNVVAHNVNGTAPNPWVLNFDNGYGNPKGMQNVVFDHNVVFDWGSIGRNAQLASYDPNVIVNLTLTNNDIQNSVDSTYLAMLASTLPNLSAQIHGSGNRWYRASGSEDQMFHLAGSDMSFSQFMSATGDTTSTFGAVSYPDPWRTIESYHGSLGGGPSLGAFMTGARGQSRASWRVVYTAAAVNAYVFAGFGL